MACAVLGALMAAIVPGAESMLDSVGARDLIERLGGVGALQETLVAALVSVLAIVISCFAVTVVTHGGVEEHDGRTEEVLATATARSTTFLAVGLVALGGAAWLLLVTGLGMAIGAVGTAVSFGGVLAASLVQIPAVWVVGALALLGLAQGSRWAMAGWVVLVAFFLVGPLAELLQLPGWVADLSPYSHVPKVPAESLAIGPELVLTAWPRRPWRGLVALPARDIGGRYASLATRDIRPGASVNTPPHGCGLRPSLCQDERHVGARSRVAPRVRWHGDLHRGGVAHRAQRPRPGGETHRHARRRRPARAQRPRHFAYWRREADVAISGVVDATPGLRSTRSTSPRTTRASRSPASSWRTPRCNGLYVAHAMGRFAGADLGRHAGWPSTSSATGCPRRAARWLADPGPDDGRGRRRPALDATRDVLREVDALPRVPQHGDPAVSNLPGRDGDDVLAIDWSTLGDGPVGADLGIFLQNAREAPEPLLDAYLMGLPDGVATPDEGTFGMRVSAAYTALSRAEWALARVAGGEGALAGKYRHPAVAPYLRALQRQFGQIEALLWLRPATPRADR